MDKFWERYIQSRPADSKGAFDAFAAAHRDPGPRNMADGGRIGYDDGQLVAPTVDGSRPGYQGPLRVFEAPGFDKFSDALLDAYAKDDITKITRNTKFASVIADIKSGKHKGASLKNLI